MASTVRLKGEVEKAKVATDKDGKPSRHCTLFDKIRFKAMREIPRYKQIEGIEYKDWLGMLRTWCEAANSFESDKGDLTDASIEATAEVDSSLDLVRIHNTNR
ncbi:hypothetical protein [Shewanella sp. 10N.286.48.A6]|uniref:hypothetical protein n=1 Tax=Shewanella sp. 10N.286.48.A6 TaxID=1880833 RepID=UPI0039A60BCC